MKLVSVQINAQGKTHGDIELALEEALSRIRQGFTSGGDRNESGFFNFTVDGQEEPSEG
jgi:hypothetical protein